MLVASFLWRMGVRSAVEERFRVVAMVEIVLVNCHWR
jgi:hypothetical protein